MERQVTPPSTRANSTIIFKKKNQDMKFGRKRLRLKEMQKNGGLMTALTPTAPNYKQTYHNNITQRVWKATLIKTSCYKARSRTLVNSKGLRSSPPSVSMNTKSRPTRLSFPSGITTSTLAVYFTWRQAREKLTSPSKSSKTNTAKSLPYSLKSWSLQRSGPSTQKLWAKDTRQLLAKK